MQRSTKITLLTVCIAVPALISGRILWPDAPDLHIQPTPTQMALLVLLATTEATMFGLGIALLVSGWPLLDKLPTSKTEARWVGLSAIWLLVNWWPHINLHRHFGERNLNNLIAIDYGFHFTAILATLVIARSLWKHLLRRLPLN